MVFFFQAEDGIRDYKVTGVQTCALPILGGGIRQKGRTMIIGSGAQVDGPIHFEGDRPATVSPGAKLASPVEFKQMEKKQHYREGGYYVWQVIWAAAFILFGDRKSVV